MTLYKRCNPSARPTLRDGSPNPFNCASSPKCEHPWHYRFSVHLIRYRETTETHQKNLAEQIEAKERTRLVEGRHQIRREPDVTFRAFGEMYLRDHAICTRRPPSETERSWPR